jgi:hypothetical protein
MLRNQRMQIRVGGERRENADGRRNQLGRLRSQNDRFKSDEERKRIERRHRGLKKLLVGVEKAREKVERGEERKGARFLEGGENSGDQIRGIFGGRRGGGRLRLDLDVALQVEFGADAFGGRVHREDGSRR